MKKILLFFKIVQIIDNEQRRKSGLNRIGKGYFKAYRLNPYNPICYFIIILAIPICIFLFGIVGVYGKIENPFKWN